jgi:hypothetical protein
MLRRVALVRTDVSEELNASFIRVTKMGELGTTLAVTSNRCTLSSQCSIGALLVTASVVPSSPIFCHPDEGGAKFLRNVGSKKSHVEFFIVTTMKTSNLTVHRTFCISCAYFCKPWALLKITALVSINHSEQFNHFVSFFSLSCH